MASKNQAGRSNNDDNGERGFAAMSDSKQREIARMGGEAVSQDRDHMAEIGRKGGEASAESRSASSNERSFGSSSRASGRNDDDSGGGSHGARGTRGNSVSSDSRSGGSR